MLSAFILALVIVVLNQAVMSVCEQMADKQEDLTSISFLLKTNAIRAGALLAVVCSVLIFAEIHQVYFILSFMLLYISTLFTKLISYGTK